MTTDGFERHTKERNLRIRLAGGPGPLDFEVFDADTGDRLLNVVSVELTVGGHEPPTVRVELFQGFVVDATLDAEVAETSLVAARVGLRD